MLERHIEMYKEMTKKTKIFDGIRSKGDEGVDGPTILSLGQTNRWKLIVQEARRCQWQLF